MTKYFNPGDIVTLRHNLLGAVPLMLVTEVVRDSENQVLGIRCNWYTTTNEWVEGVFNFKDLILV